MTARTVRVPPLEVAVDEGRGPVVVLVHGIATNATSFERLIPLLTPSHRVVAVNLLGCGNSPAPDIDYTVDQHVRSIRSTLLRRGIFLPFTLVGHSMGGLIAARFAATHRAWVNRLILAGTPIYPPVESLANPFDRAQLGLYTEFYNFLKTNPQFTSLTAQAFNAISPIPNSLVVTARGWDATQRSMTNVIQGQHTLTDLTLVTAPVDLVYGTLDPFLARAGTDAAARLMNVTPHPVEFADHLIREPVARVIADLINVRNRPNDRGPR